MFHKVSYWCFRRTQFIPRFGGVLQESGKIVEGCLTVKNLWGLLTEEMMGFVSLGFRKFKSRSSKNTPEML